MTGLQLLRVLDHLLILLDNMLNTFFVTFPRLRLRKVFTLIVEEAIFPELLDLPLDEFLPQLRNLLADLTSEISTCLLSFHR